MDSLDPLGDLAQRVFGLPYLYPLQRLVAANVLDAASHEEGFRQVALLPTGFGKSLCFQLPALLLPGITVAVYPLLALMADQARRCAELGIGAALFRGGLSRDEVGAAETAVASGQAKLVITNPESLRGRLLDFLGDREVSHLAIDEAHCVAEWGETFRPGYLGLGEAALALKPRALSAFTATASPPVLEAVARHLFGGRAFSLIQGDPDRPNISYAVVPTLARERTLEALLLREARPAIVFASSREGVQLLAEELRARLGTGEIRFYHAGLDRAEKDGIEAWFFASATGILVSTCAYGMGVDKRDVRTIIHAEAPASVEAYIQEAGRAGRDGKPARAFLLAPPPSGRERPGEDEVRRGRRLALEAYARGRDACRRESLLRLLGVDLASPCTGCDVCEGRVVAEAEGLAELGALARWNPRRFDRAEALRLLGRQGGEPPVCAGSGGLRSWRREDILAALGAAEGLGAIRFVGRGPWKGRLLPSGRP